MEIVKKVYSFDGTVKYLLRLKDGAVIETVFYPFSRISSFVARIIFFGSYFKMPIALYNYLPTRFFYNHTDFYGICVSSQIGCKLGCKFCATGKQKFLRNLSKEEIEGQISTALYDYQPKNIKKLEVVFAGMGEPLLNYENVALAIKELPAILKSRGITEVQSSIMTTGIVPALEDMIKDNIKVNLFISLHSTEDYKRAELMPIGNKYRIKEILDAAFRYREKSGTRAVRINYTLIKGINDTENDTKILVDIAKKYGFILQIKMFNPIPCDRYQRVSLKVLRKFLNILKYGRVPYIFDISKGISNMSGCGQLKYYYEDKNCESGVQ